MALLNANGHESVRDTVTHLGLLHAHQESEYDKPNCCLAVVVWRACVCVRACVRACVRVCVRVYALLSSSDYPEP